MEPLYAKIISTITIFTMSCVFGILPIFVAKKYPMHTIESPSYNKKAKRNMIFSFLLNFGGGVLFANCFCHWLPEIREGIERKNIETKIPIAEVVTCAGFLFVCFLEELIHHFVHPHKKSTKAQKNVIEKNGTTTLNEFEMYDAKLKESVESNKDNHENDIGTENHQGQETKSLLRTAFVVASLSFHSAITGLTLGLEEEASGVWINLAAIASHKFVIAFSVGVEMVSSKATTIQYAVSIMIFSFAPCVGTITGIIMTTQDIIADPENNLTFLLLQECTYHIQLLFFVKIAVATGTVIYVVFFEIFPKAKQIGGTGFQHVFSIIVGYLAFFPSIFIHAHNEHDDTDPCGNQTLF